jgi:cytochrome P450
MALRQRFGEWNRGEGAPLEDVFFDPDLGCRVVVGYDAALQVFEQRGADAATDPPLSTPPTDPGAMVFAEGEALMLRHLFFQRSPTWERLRRVLMQQLGIGVTTAMAPSLAGHAERLLDAAIARGRMEVLSDIARPLIWGTVFDLMAAPEAQRRALTILAEAARMIFELQTTGAEKKAAYLAFVGLCRAVERLLFSNAAPETPMMCGMLAAVETGVWSREEAISQLAVLVIAGLNSPITAIASMLHNLAITPKAWIAARAGTLSADAIIDETLRLGPPSLAVPKTIVAPMDIGGVALQAEERVLILVGRANRDPRIFDHPDRFDPWRVRRRNLAFGAGRHKCPGKHLAGIELRAVLSAFLMRLPAVTLAKPPEWTESVHGERVFARLELQL